MERYFNTEGICIPTMHYMVPLDERLRRIKNEYVDRGSYFLINRGRQYGKTTTLQALADFLQNEYIVISMDFQELGDADFKDETAFSFAFAKIFLGLLEEEGSSVSHIDELRQFVEDGRNGKGSLLDLFLCLSRICQEAPRPIVLLIDEVDSASNNQVFLSFLSILRKYYLNRNKKAIFHSVILAGVYDIKNLKLKMRPEEEHKYNSPWNIAAEFEINMSFSAEQIAAMLREYETDKKTSMDIAAVSQEIYQYTSGYPYLVSKICKILDEKVCRQEFLDGEPTVWTRSGVAKAVAMILTEAAPLFQSMVHQLEQFPEIKQMLKAVLFQGKRISFNADTPAIQLAAMFGYIINQEGSIQVSNRIFETRLYNLFLSEDELTNAIYDRAQGNKSQFIKNNRLDMEVVLRKFVEYFTDIYSGSEEKFVEEQGRRLFLLYLKPIINGTGNYYIEARTRDARRTDVVVDYLGEQFVIELKIWHGNEYNERGEEQLADYLDSYHLEQGYMLSFNFNKKKDVGVREISVRGKRILEGVV